jgi:hypothetical protein
MALGRFDTREAFRELLRLLPPGQQRRLWRLLESIIFEPELNYKAPRRLQGTGVPSTAVVLEDGWWGFYVDTATDDAYFFHRRGGVVEYAFFGPAGTYDPNALHDNTADEIHQIANKAVPVDADELVMEDSADSWLKKRATIANLLATQHDHVETDITDLDHNDVDAIHDNVNGEVNAIASKATPVTGDLILIEDSAASWAKKKITIGDLPGGDGDCPEYKFIKATGQSEGDIHLSDVTNWNTSNALIKKIRIETTSTDWDAYILQNDNGYSTDDANIPAMQIMDAGSGDLDIDLDHPYEDEDTSSEVHLYLIDNAGTATFDIYVLGYGLSIP